ncbi:MAG TPA: DNA mismatch repair endonuclease MutL, partial [Nannocystis exedens]|nr:DNA mismatch repair endonuclease MutL [Nannocystis exedens]
MGFVALLRPSGGIFCRCLLPRLAPAYLAGVAVVHQRSSASKGARITVLNPALADQIAAGEVVERPASVVKELVENAVDAGATRVDVELVDGGLGVIRVIDNGVGIHPEDLAVAIMRHGTSKIRGPEDLVDIQTLGFRGEALASMAAVAHLSLRSRQRDAEIGAEIRTVPGEVPRPVPVGMPMGTQVEIRGLFANVPARRKFMRSEATEVGHCSETLLRIALVNPSVHLTLRHGRRELLNLSSGTLDMRVAQVLGRRASGPFFALSGEEDQIRLSAWLASPLRNHGGRSGLYIVTRRRVVKERNISQILSQALGDALRSKSPVGCLIVEPPPATVDVNVHPQKSEIRFSDPQRVYAAIRRILAAELVRAPWSESASQGAQDLASTELIDAPGARSAAGRPDGPVDRWAARRPEPEAPSLRGRGAVEDPKSARAGGSRSAKGSVPGPRRRAWSGPEQSAAGLGSADQSTPEQGSAGQGNAESPILEQGAGGHGSAGRSIPEQGAGGYGSAGRSIPERGAGGHGSAGRSIPEQGAGGFGSAGQSTPEQGSAGQGNAESSDFERPHGGAAEDASRPRGPADPGASGRAYRLSTRALDPSYGAHKREI